MPDPSDRHTAEVGDFVKGKVRVALPLSIVFLILLLWPILLVTISTMSARRSATDGVSSGNGVTMPTVHQARFQQVRKNQTTPTGTVVSKTAPCHTPLVGEVRSGSGLPEPH